MCEAGVSFNGNSLIIEIFGLIFKSFTVFDRLNKEFCLLKQ